MLKQKLEKILEYGIYLWIFLLPWQVRYFYEAKIRGGAWEAGNISIYASEIVLLILLVINFILWAANKTSGKNWFKHIDITKSILWLIIFVIFAFLSAGWSIFPALSVYYGLKLFLGLGIVWLLSTNKLSANKLATIIVASGMIQGILAIGQFLNQLVWGSKWLGMAGQDPQNLGVSVVDTGFRRWLRAYGSFPHPNILGGYLVLTLGFAWWLFQQAETIWLKAKNRQIQIYEITLSFSIIIIVSGILLSFSRVAWLATGLLFLITLLQLIFKKAFISAKTFSIVFLLTILTTGLWVGIYSEPFITRIKASERLEQLSFTQRIDSYEDAWLSFKQHPWLGTGLGVYTYSLHEQYPKRYVWELQPPHNTFLLVMAELGIVGLVLLLIIFFLFTKSIFYQPQALSIFSLLIFLMLFDHWWWSLSLGIYLLLLFSGIFLYKKE